MNTDGRGPVTLAPQRGEGRGEGWLGTDALDMAEIARRITPHPHSLSPLGGEGGRRQSGSRFCGLSAFIRGIRS